MKSTSAEFIDTNVLLYAHDAGDLDKHRTAVELIARLSNVEIGALSIQVLSEFYWNATRKLGISTEEAEQIVGDFRLWTIHRPTHFDLLQAARLQRRHGIAWWDALVVQSASELGCQVLWTEDLTHGHKYGGVTVKNPFR